MSVLKKLQLVFPLMEFETPELKAQFNKIVEYLDRDLDESGFDSSSTTDEAIDKFIDLLEVIENPVIVAIGSEEFIEDLFDEDEELEEAVADAVTLSESGEGEEVTETEEVVESVEITEVTISVSEDDEDEDEDDEVVLISDDDDFESELEDEVSEIERIARTMKEQETNAEGNESKGDSTT